MPWRRVQGGAGTWRAAQRLPQGQQHRDLPYRARQHQPSGNTNFTLIHSNNTPNVTAFKGSF